MAAVPIKVPSVGESITEGILSRWLKPDGAQVKAGEAIYELETDKASSEVPAETSGTLKISVAEGQAVAIGSVVGSIDPSAAPVVAPASSPTKDRAATTAPAPPEQAAPPRAASAEGDGSRTVLSPAVRRIVAETHADPTQIKGTGPGGRITKADALALHETAPSELDVAQPTAAPAALAADRPGPRETRKRMSGIRQKIAQRLVAAQQTAAILTTFNEADMSRVIDLRTRYKDAFKAKHGVSLGFMSFFVKACLEALRAFPLVNGRIDGADIVINNSYDIGVAVSTERGLMVPVIRDAD